MRPLAHFKTFFKKVKVSFFKILSSWSKVSTSTPLEFSKCSHENRSFPFFYSLGFVVVPLVLIDVGLGCLFFYLL